MRTPKEIREEMSKLNAKRPQYCKSNEDWLKIIKHNELYQQWIEALREQQDEPRQSD